MSLHKCWSLYNKEEKLRIDDLRVDQVRTILLAIPSAKISEWYACREGDLHWQSLAEVPDFYEDAMAAKGKGPLPPPEKDGPPSTAKPQAPRRPLFEDVNPDTETTLQVESVATKERRTARRYVRNLIFRISSPVKFECATEDISMSGISLKEKLPDGLPKGFRAELSLNGTNLKISVNRVSDTTLKINDAEGWDVLRNWIVNW